MHGQRQERVHEASLVYVVRLRPAKGHSLKKEKEVKDNSRSVRLLR